MERTTEPHITGAWAAPDVTVDDLRAYASTGRRFGFTWWQRLAMRIAARAVDRYDRTHH